VVIELVRRHAGSEELLLHLQDGGLLRAQPLLLGVLQVKEHKVHTDTRTLFNRVTTGSIAAAPCPSHLDRLQVSHLLLTAQQFPLKQTAEHTR